MSNEHLQKNIVSELTAKYQFKIRGEWLREGICPSCSKKQLYTHGTNPIMVKCGRLNKCGFEGHVRDLLPDLFINFNEKYPAKQENPNATANAYMELVRGINPVKMRGNWRQGSYFNPNAEGNKGTATVLFEIAPGITMERFVEDLVIIDADGKKDVRKAHFTGKHRGLWWQPNGMKIEKGDTVWIVEGCIDALSLWSKGIKAVAIFSCYNYPETKLNEYCGIDITWVWALDNDPAGRKQAIKHHDRLEAISETSKAALPPKSERKSDWNDLFIQDKLDDKTIEYCCYLGSLALAKSQYEKGFLIWEKTRSNGFHFQFRQRTYWFNFDHDKFKSAENHLVEKDEMPRGDPETERMAAKQAGTIFEIANCTTQFLYFLTNKITDESWYYARIDFPHGGASVKNTFSGSQIASASEFKKRLLSIAPGAIYSGASSHLNHIIMDDLFGIKTVETVDYIGYTKEHKAFIYNNKAVSNGDIYKLNEEDFFQIGKTSIKSLCSSPNLILGDENEYNDEWTQHYWTAFKENGLVALAYWIGSYFAEQIRGSMQSYPFLELFGEPGSGKSTILEFLWKLSGRADYEGFDPSKSTLAARSRNFSQVSNLPVVLIESERDDSAKSAGFDWDELKTAYNGRASRSRGVKNNGNDTIEPPFRGALVIAQNASINASEAILQRLVQIEHTKALHTPEGKEASNFLNKIDIERVSYFLLKCISKEKQILDHIAKWTPVYEKQLMGMDGIRSVRIALNHAQILALLDIAAGVLKISPQQKDSAREFVCSIAKKREIAIGQDHQDVQDFWDVYEFISKAHDGLKINHHNSPDEYIAINLPQFTQLAAERKQQLPQTSDLKRHLRTSMKNKFVDMKAIRSGIWNDKTVKCWIFKKGD